MCSYQCLSETSPTTSEATESIVCESTLHTWKTKRPPYTQYKDKLDEFLSTPIIETNNPPLW